jgi:hypothetical protein
VSCGNWRVWFAALSTAKQKGKACPRQGRLLPLQFNKGLQGVLCALTWRLVLGTAASSFWSELFLAALTYPERLVTRIFPASGVLIVPNCSTPVLLPQRCLGTTALVILHNARLPDACRTTKAQTCTSGKQLGRLTEVTPPFGPYTVSATVLERTLSLPPLHCLMLSND